MLDLACKGFPGLLHRLHLLKEPGELAVAAALRRWIWGWESSGCAVLTLTSSPRQRELVSKRKDVLSPPS